MGFWDWFRREPPRASEVDRIWLSKTAKLAGLAVEVSATSGPVLILAHFPETLRETREALAAVGFPGEIADDPVDAAEYLRQYPSDGAPLPLFALVSQLRPTQPLHEVAGDPVKIIVAERHFLRAHDDEVSRFAAGIARPALVEFFYSLDEPMMKEFAGAWISDVLRRLGIKETDAIESNLVLRRVKAVQAKYASTAHGDTPADSAQAWFEQNR